MPEAEQRTTLRRRALLVAALAGSLAGLTSCGIRLESDAPHIPGLKEEGPPADQAVLRTVLTTVETAVRAATGDSAPWATKLARVHAAQRTRLVAVMATQGMTPAPTPTVSPATTVSAVALPTFEAGAARDIGALAGLTTRNLPMAAAIGVTHHAAASVLGRTVRVAGGSVPKPPQAAAILPSLQAATYALEMIVAKTPLKSRKRAETTVATLHAARAAWQASLGNDAPLQPDGYSLPVQPTTDASRTKLARLVLTDLQDACAEQVAATRDDRASFIGLTDLWADATTQLWLWGGPPTAFPGLQ